MKTTKLFFAALATLALGACQKDGVELSKPVTANIQCNIGNGPSTRAVNATWENNDGIGLYVKENTAANTWTPYTIKNGPTANNLLYSTVLKYGATYNNETYMIFTGETAIPFPSNNDSLSFQAYYPYQPTTGGYQYTTLGGTSAAPLFTISNWNDQLNSKKFDLMISEVPTVANNCVKTAEQVQASADGANIPLRFHHMFSKIILNITVNETATQLRPGDLSGMSVSAAGMNVQASCNVLGNYSSANIISKGSPVNENITFVTKTNGTSSEAIICPDYNTNTMNRKVTFTLAGGKGTFVWTIPSGTKFESGKSYIWSIRLNGDGVAAVLMATIEDWNPVVMDKNGNIVEDPENAPDEDLIIDVEKQ